MLRLVKEREAERQRVQDLEREMALQQAQQGAALATASQVRFAVSGGCWLASGGDFENGEPCCAPVLSAERQGARRGQGRGTSSTSRVESLQVSCALTDSKCAGRPAGRAVTSRGG